MSDKEYAYCVRLAAGIALKDGDYTRARQLREYHDVTLRDNPADRSGGAA